METKKPELTSVEIRELKRILKEIKITPKEKEERLQILEVKKSNLENKIKTTNFSIVLGMIATASAGALYAGTDVSGLTEDLKLIVSLGRYGTIVFTATMLIETLLKRHTLGNKLHDVEEEIEVLSKK